MKINRIGETNISNQGYEMKVIEYKNNSNIIVEFQDEHRVKVHTSYQQFKNGNIKNPFHKSVFGIGYIGEGKYKTKENGRITKVYGIWHSMLQRCYEPYTINKRPTYIDCYVCSEWHNFQNFGKWYEENYYEIENEIMCLDKDILIKGNKIYSPENCIFVTNRINSLFIKSDANRGKYPIGVSWCKENNKFKVQCQILNKENNRKQIHLGYYDSIEESFFAYKQFKESYIKEVADEYRKLIPQKLYEAMYRYEVEIND